MPDTSPQTRSWLESLPQPAAAVVDALVQSGRRAVLVGPAARARALGDALGDLRRFDVVTDMERSGLRRLLESTRGISAPDGGGRGVITVRGTADDGVKVLVGPFRRLAREDGALARRVRGPVERDLASRELTIHAIAVDERGEVIDPFGGLDDLRARRLRTVARPADLRQESPRWILRFARHAGYYGFVAAPAVLDAAFEQRLGLVDISPDVWRGEIQRALMHRFPNQALQFLESAGVLSLLLPEVQALVGFEKSCPVHHKDIWDHTKQVVQKSQVDPAQRWTALLHDIGKANTRTVDPDGSVHFFRHEELSAIYFAGIAARLRFPADVAEKVEFLIRNHSRVNLYNGDWSESAIRRLIREVGDMLPDLLAFSKADITSRREEKVEQIRRLMEDLEARIAVVQEKDARVPPLPTGIGNLIMQRFELAPSPTVGILRKRLEDLVESGQLARGLEADEYIEHLAKLLEEESA